MKDKEIESVPPSAVEDQLALVLADPAFGRSPRICALLNYLVGEELRGAGERLKGYSVGVEGLGKPEDFDPSTDAGVRVETGRLRRMLEAYYRENPDVQVRISVPKGTYRPSFEWLHSNPDVALENFSSPAAGPAIAVVEFTGEDSQSAMARQLSLEIRMELFRYREYQLVDVVPARVSGSLQDHCRDELECEFMLNGSVTAAGAVNVSVTDLHLGRLLWVQQFDSEGVPLQELARQIVLPLAKPSGMIPVAAFQKRYGRNPAEWNAADCILRWHFYRLRDRTAPNHAALRQQVRRLLAEDPWFGLGYVIYAMLTLDEVAYGLNPTGTVEDTMAKARYQIDQAMSADSGNCALAHYVKAQTQYFSGDLAGFFNSIDRTLALHPNNPDLQHHCGVFLCCAGEIQRGVTLIQQADLLHNSGIGYRFAYLLLDLTGLLDVGGSRLYETTYVPDQLLIGHLLGALLYAREGQRDEALRCLQKVGARSAEPNPVSGELDILSLVDLWLKDETMNHSVRQQLADLTASSNVIPIKS